MIEKEDPVITEEEAAQYDRQIRLWGLDAQKRLRGSKVLLAGLGGLGAEVAKNLILAGVKGLTLLDHDKGNDQSWAQFLIPVTERGQNRAQASLERAQILNPMVEVLADRDRVEDKPDSFFLQFNAVCLTCCSKDTMVRIDQLCSQHNILVFCGDVHGYYGYMFCNLGPEHNYVEEKPKVVKKAMGDSNDGPDAKKVKVDPNETTMVKKTSKFCRLKEALEVDWTSDKAKAALKRTPVDYFLLHVMLKFRTDKGRDPDPKCFKEDSQLLSQIRQDVLSTLGVDGDLFKDDFINFCFSEMSPVCAVVGGVLGQEIVKALSQRDAPHRNFFFFDARKGNGIVDYFGPN
ncbi:SUMO-activating enzyme subunit 1 isoform X2 [Corythoichthys intestinalis]|nr:SUMO-activating enzyme subunit 1 isoform X2 [Corythoichthys intestinalis]XP_057695204.1 SUMO-activating enzyme subunit 1 isoform X2 [Corythoichthys intestinalis]XP_061797739.1 SUMO-activating enzyme subunit 1-like [Nerophis lumbriciformis]